MPFMQFLTRGRHISSCLAIINSSTITTSTVINFIIVTIFLSVTSVTARVIRHPSENTGSHHHQHHHHHHHHPSPTSFEDLQKQLIVQEFKRRIYDHMGWSEPPISKNISHYRELYRNEIQEFLNTTNQYHIPNDYHDTEERKSSKAFTFRLTPSDKRLKVPVVRGNAKPSTFSSLLHFTIPGSPELDNHQTSYSLESARLHMRFGHLRRRLLKSTKSRFLIKVYLLDENRKSSSSANTTSSKSVFLQSFFINPKKSSKIIELNNQSQSKLSTLFSNSKSPSNNLLTFKVTVTEIVSPFQHNVPRYYTKLLKLSKYSNPSPSYIDITTKLEVNLSNQKNPAKTRSRRSTDCSNSNSQCCNRAEIYIYFRDIGLDKYALTPQGYIAYYCKGVCPLGYKPNEAFSRVKAQLHAQDPDFPAPKCASSSYAPITFAHVGEMDNFEFVTISDMVVTGCKCY